MFKSLITFSCCSIALLGSQSALAQISCQQLDDQANQQATLYQPNASMKVKGSRTSRQYFYSAPAERCRQNQLFLVGQNQVTAYSDINIARQTWINVMYVRPDGSTVQGWMKKQAF
ncbi:hypothetical protein E0H86_11010 [Acinetobacter sp. ANC 4635]|uniref:hypothetical protein n=1 Tax=Acinetobacter sp. ANC 4635 TaxID=2529846 RepID=UPI00103FD51E|nr:hypothetical protein [Acinetobacter sp. ANC 4635]TCB29545.1 hypothetical protein E0H86_11010 [Acinetobacter sp. ANC 4635]